jgi:hypothetical protein
VTCQFVKKNSERCKRSVADGKPFCWQHTRGLLAKWHSLTKKQTVGFYVGVASLAATLWFGVHAVATIHVQSSGDNSVHIGHGATVSPSSTGDCSPNIIGGSNTVNCAPPPPKTHWTQERLAAGAHITHTVPTVSMASNDKLPTDNLANPGVVVKASIDRTATITGYRVTCDRPCQLVNVISDAMGGAFQGLLTNEVDGDDKVVLAGATTPIPMPSNYQIEMEIHSRDTKDVRVEQVTLILRP